MLKKLLVLAVAMCALNAQAGEFDGGSPEYDERPNPNYTESEIQHKIENEMKANCVGNLCQIVSQDQNGSGWTVTFNVGYGNPQGNGTGNNFYIGDRYQDNDKQSAYAGITVTYKNYKCTSKLRVTPAVYRFVQTYMYNNVNPDGSPKRNFSPADQTVILFYNTLVNKVDSCGANAR